MGVQGQVDLKGVLVEEIPFTGGVFFGRESQHQGTAFARQLFGGDLGPVQGIGQLKQPGQLGFGQGALAVDFSVLSGGQGQDPVFVVEGVSGGHVPQSGVVAVVGDGLARHAVKLADYIDPRDLALGGKVGVDDFLFRGGGGGSPGRQDGPGQEGGGQQPRRSPAGEKMEIHRGLASFAGRAAGAAFLMKKRSVR